MKITEADRIEFPYHTDKSIAGIKVIRKISDKQLLVLLEDSEELERLRIVIGVTNPNWVLGRIAEESYDRGLIDEIKLDKFHF